MKSVRPCLLLLAFIGLPAIRASATPLLSIGLEGSTDGINFSSVLNNLLPGQVIQYELVSQVAPVGTTNGSKAITSLTDHPTASTAGYDGLNNLSVTLTGASMGSFTTGSLYTDSGNSGSDFALSASATSGTLTPGSISGIIGGLPAGYFEGANVQALIYTGTFTLGSADTPGSSGMISASYGGGGAGFEFNSNPTTGSDTLANKVSISTTDSNGYLGFSPLTLNVAAVPEPSTTSLFLLAVCGLLTRRRSRV